MIVSHQQLWRLLVVKLVAAVKGLDLGPQLRVQVLNRQDGSGYCDVFCIEHHASI